MDALQTKTKVEKLTKSISHLSKQQRLDIVSLHCFYLCFPC
jgi:hypothetical protein